MGRHSERKQLRRKSRRRIADKTSNALMAIYERAKQGGSDLMINQPHETRPPASGDLSFRREGSHVAGRYYDPTKNGTFRDSRNRKYEIDGGTIYRRQEAA